MPREVFPDREPSFAYRLTEAIGSAGLELLAAKVGGDDAPPAAPAPPSIVFDEGQFGAKLGRHAHDFGLNPKSPQDRIAFYNKLESIVGSPDRVVAGSFRGQGTGGAPGDVLFYLKQYDAVVVNEKTAQYVTVLRGGLNNDSVQRALSGQTGP